ncbi:hypothetical protein LTR22_024196 [Elasticomyces elasticus]|nr:hypothetical protein LTR22_024196 [Elasticomyces elasticus]KAK4909854.1 hypothetical protein LTR49_021394 [Elasticomyces elasticus]
MKLTIKSLLLAPPAAPLVSKTNSKRSPLSPASIMQDNHKKQLTSMPSGQRSKPVRSTGPYFLNPSYSPVGPLLRRWLRACISTADSKRWPNRGVLDRSFIKRLALNDIDSFRPAPVIHAPSLLALLQAVTAMTKQNKKARRRYKGR